MSVPSGSGRRVKPTLEAVQQASRKRLNMLFRKRLKLVFLEKIEHALAVQRRDETDMVPPIKRVQQVNTFTAHQVSNRCNLAYSVLTVCSPGRYP